MYPPILLHIPEGGSLALASVESKLRGDSCDSCASTVAPNRVKKLLLNSVDLSI
jgi:hypothetical protein